MGAGVIHACPNRDSGEDIIIVKPKIKHGDNWIHIEAGGLWLKSLRRIAHGKCLCWWGCKQHETAGCAVVTTCGYCVYGCNARIRRRKITLSKWKKKMGMVPKVLEAHQTLTKVMVDAIVGKRKALKQNA